MLRKTNKSNARECIEKACSTVFGWTISALEIIGGWFYGHSRVYIRERLDAEFISEESANNEDLVPEIQVVNQNGIVIIDHVDQNLQALYINPPIAGEFVSSPHFYK